MSYHTQVQLSFEGADFFASVSDEEIQPKLAAAASEFDLYPPRRVNPFYADSGNDWFADKLMLMSGYREQAEEFLKYMSLKFPGVTFFGRGLGEEFEDVWAVAYLRGEAVGPPPSVGTPHPSNPSEPARRDGGLFKWLRR